MISGGTGVFRRRQQPPPPLLWLAGHAAAGDFGRKGCLFLLDGFGRRNGSVLGLLGAGVNEDDLNQKPFSLHGKVH
ncbi:hypothetical protein TIFTF001_053203 [Ficus carica]|uniref:Uncharacterized protein n=1 Tax=Ficus carica TaxID=3494 RepID=A0AA88EGW4_FICCA|nr:hypothetical protein TIFTF001_053203 [Ficus carica]